MVINREFYDTHLINTEMDSKNVTVILHACMHAITHFNFYKLKAFEYLEQVFKYFVFNKRTKLIAMHFMDTIHHGRTSFQIKQRICMHSTRVYMFHSVLIKKLFELTPFCVFILNLP